MISCTENLNFQLTLKFYSSITVLCLKQYLFQNKLQRTGLQPLFEIIEKFITKLKFPNYMILQFRLIFITIHTVTMQTLKTLWLDSFA